VSKHYHVISGLQGGYIPNTNDVYPTKSAALDGAKWHLDAYYEADEKVIGSRKAGLWQMRQMSVGGFADYIEVTGPCFEAEHETEEWQESW
jgi:hypothetical protein